jgi:RNA polymerase sigma-70 factor (ECF subfamily)
MHGPNFGRLDVLRANVFLRRSGLRKRTLSWIISIADNRIGHQKKARKNNQVERELILERLRERIVRFAASRLSRDSAEDLAQEVLLVLHEKYPLLDRVEDLLPLSLEIARFKIMGARRKTHRRGEDTQISVDDLPLASQDADAFTQASHHENLQRLEEALVELGERCRELIRWKLEGHTFPEIQKRMGVNSLNTLYTWDFRCRKQLLERLGGEWDLRDRRVGAGEAQTVKKS